MADVPVYPRGPFAPHAPFRVDRLPFFYGWFMVGMVVILMLTSGPGQTTGVSPFTESLLQAFGISRETLSYAYLGGTLASACCIPFAGRLVDKWGSRAAALFACGLMTAVLLVLGRLDELLFRIVPGPLPPLTVALALGVCFAGLRFAGQGLMMLCGQVTMSHWFERRRGLANGISGVAMVLVGSAAPLAIRLLVDLWAWQGTWLFLGNCMIPLAALVIWCCWRDAPEPCNLHPDGLDPAAAARSRGVASTRINWTRGQALGTRAFWNVMLMQAWLGLVVTGICFHLEDLGAGVGLGKTEAFAFLIPMSITVTVVGLVGGVIADRIQARPLLVLQSLILAGAMLVLTRFGPGWIYWLAALSLGTALGLAGPIGFSTFPRFFGRQHLGAINGVQWAGVVLGSALGPAIFASLERGGSYDRAFYVMFPVPLLLGIVGLWLKPPVHPDERR